MNSATAERPPVPHAPAPGFVWAAREAGPDWQPADEGKGCRAQGESGTAHGAPAAVRQLRGLTRRVWWQLCLQHSDGHWAENGRVLHWVLEEEPGTQTSEKT